MKSHKIYLKVFALALCSWITFSCSEDDNTDYSNVAPEPSNTTITTNVPSNIAAFVEKDSIFTFTISVDNPQTVDLRIPITMIEASEGLDGDDVSFPSAVTLNALSSSVTFDIEIKGNDSNDAESNETFTLQIGENVIANASMNATTVQFTLENNYILGETLDITLDWDKTIDYLVGEDVEYSACAQVDLDFAVFANSTGAFQGYFGAATGACPEHLALPSDLANDIYLIVGIWYADGFPGDIDDVALPVTSSFYRQGTLETELSYTQPESGAFTTTSADNAQSLVAAVEIENGNFTMMSVDAEELGTAKIESLKVPSEYRRH